MFLIRNFSCYLTLNLLRRFWKKKMFFLAQKCQTLWHVHELIFKCKKYKIKSLHYWNDLESNSVIFHFSINVLYFELYAIADSRRASRVLKSRNSGLNVKFDSIFCKHCVPLSKSGKPYSTWSFFYVIISANFKRLWIKIISGKCQKRVCLNLRTTLSFDSMYFEVKKWKLRKAPAFYFNIALFT